MPVGEIVHCCSRCKKTLDSNWHREECPVSRRSYDSEIQYHWPLGVKNPHLAVKHIVWSGTLIARDEVGL